MKYAFYTNSERAWRGMYDAIAEATESVFWEIYILRNNTPQFAFLELLKKKAKAGVRVRIVIDRVGSFWFREEDMRSLRESGVEILFFTSLLKSMLRRTHRKILIVDERVCFLGGVNVAEEHRTWPDLQVKLSGRIVRSFVRSFARGYVHAGGRDPLLLAAARSKKGTYPTRFWLLDNWPFKGHKYLYEYYQRKIRTAQKSIVIVTPYCLPHRWFFDSLIRARERGVRVTIVIPEYANHLLAAAGNTIAAIELSRAGVQVLMTPQMIHAKVLLVDDAEGLVGSNNIDAQSFDFNVEASLVFERKDMVGDLRTILAHWQKDAKLFDPEKYSKKWYSGVLAWLARILQPVL